MTTETTSSKSKHSKIIQCGKNEFLLNSTHVFAIVLIYLVGVTALPEAKYLFLFLSFGLYITLVIRIRNSGLIHLDLVFFIFLFIYSFSVPLSYALTQQDYYQATIQESADLCMLAYSGYAFGLLLDSGKNRKNAPLTLIDSKTAELIRKSGMWVFFIGALASVGAIAFTSGFSVYLSAGYAGRALLKQQEGPIELGLYFSIVGLFGIFVATLLSKKKERLSMILVILAFVFFFLYISFLGIRRPLLLLAMGLLAGYSMIRHRPKLIVSLPLAAIAFAFLSTFAQYRQLISSVGLGATIDFIQDNASLEWLDISDTELGAPFRTLVDYLENGKLNSGILLGSSYIESLIYVMPSFITGGMQSLSVQYTRNFFSADFIAIGGNMGLFPVTEAFLNFGAVGPLAVFFLFGFLLSKLNRWFHGVGRGNGVYIVLFMMLVPWTAFFMRLDMASVSKGFLYSQIVPFFLFLFIKYLYKNPFRLRS